MSCGGLRLNLGAYVLGALDPAERAVTDAHLADCAECRDELAAFAALPGLLARLTPTEAAQGPGTVDPALLDRLLVAAVRSRRSVRRRLVGAAAAALLVIGGLAAGAAALDRGGPPPAGVAHTATGAGVRATVRLVHKGWGTELALQLRGVPAGERCRLVAVAADGQREVAATWAVTYSGRVSVTGATSIATTDLRSVLVETTGGRRLVAVPLDS